MEWSTSLNFLTRGALVVYGFLVNIPSDRARLTGRGGEEEEERGEEEDSDEEWGG